MSSDWRIGLFTAQRKAMAFLAVSLILIISSGAIALASAVIASMSATATTPASAKFPTAAKVQSITDGLLCVKQGPACKDFNADITFLNEIVVDNAIYSAPAATTTPLTKSPSGWRSWATTATKGTSGSPLHFGPSDQIVTFEWGGHRFQAAFTSGNDQRLQQLTRMADVS